VLASVKQGDKFYLLDATEKTCPYNMLTPRCINGQGRVISSIRPGWVDLNSSTRYERTNIISAAIGPDGIIRGKIQMLHGNYAALDKRMEIESAKDLEEYKESLEDEYAGLTLNSYETENAENLSMPVKENMDVEIKDVASVAGNLITVTPVLFREWDYNPFRLDERKYPVDYIYPYLIKDIITYQIPEGYVLDERPQDILLSIPDGKAKFSFRLAQNGNTIQLISTIDISKSIYTAEDYSMLKEFYNTVVQKQAEKLVLKKAS